MSIENNGPRNNGRPDNRRAMSKTRAERMRDLSSGDSSRKMAGAGRERGRRNRETSADGVSRNGGTRYKQGVRPSKWNRNGNNDEKKGNGKRIAIGVIAVLIALITAAIGVLARDIGGRVQNIQTPLDPDQLSITGEIDFEEIAEGFLNVAIFGKDENEDDARTDSILIASLNRETREIRLVSVYRDTLLMMDGGFLDKACHAYTFGGSQGAVSMLNRNLDLNIHHFVTVDFRAPIKVIDSLGGVEIDVADYEVWWTNALSNEVSLYTGIASTRPTILGPGLQMLSGVQATAYSRIRKVGNDDFQRAERQREVLSQMAERARDADLRTVNDIIDTTFEYIETNFTLTEMLAYGSQVGQYFIGEQAGFPFNLVPKMLNRTGDTVVPTTLATNVTMLHEFLFDTPNFMPSSTVHTISNEISYYTATNELSTIDIENEGWEFQELPNDEWIPEEEYIPEPWEPDYPGDGTGDPGDGGYPGDGGDPGEPGSGDGEAGGTAGGT